VLRKHLLDSFDRFWIENLHGNRKISEYAPDGRTSETVFAIRGFSIGIQQGVATSLWVKNGKARKRNQPTKVLFRDDIDKAKAHERRRQLLDTLKKRRFDSGYQRAKPSRANRYSFRPENVSAEYESWPRVVDLCALPPSNGLMEKRGGALIDVEREKLAERMKLYFDKRYDWQQYGLIAKALTDKQARFDPKKARKKAMAAESFSEERIVRYALRPFDVRWCYYTGVRPVWNEPRPLLQAQCWEGNRFFVARPAGVASPEGVPFCYTRLLGDNDALRGHAYYFPLRLRNGDRLDKKSERTLFELLGEGPEDSPVANLSQPAREYLSRLNITAPYDDPQAEWLWMHALAVGYSPAYLIENADGIRRDWPRIPLPDKRKLLEESAAMGGRVAALLDTEADVPGVTAGKLEPLFRTVGVPAKVGGGQFDPNTDVLAVTAGWGHVGKGNAVMPAKGRIIRREYDRQERDAIAEAARSRGLGVDRAIELLGATTCDVYLNDAAYWKNIPGNVWDYTIGGYQVVKKWLSYRQLEVLGRPLRIEEVREVANIARRLAAIVLMQPALDDNYRAIVASVLPWPGETADAEP